MKVFSLVVSMLFCLTMVQSQNLYWSVYDFEVKSGHEKEVVEAFDRFFESESGKAMPSASLSSVMFSNSETNFSHRIAFWSDSREDFASMYTGALQQSTDFALLGMTMDKSIKPFSSTLGKSVIFEGKAGNPYRTIYVLSVSDPGRYATAFGKFRTAIMAETGGEMGLDLHQFTSGNPEGTTHAVVASAPTMAKLLEFTDKAFSSDAFKTFAAAVKDVRTIENIFTLYQAKVYNVE